MKGVVDELLNMLYERDKELPLDLARVAIERLYNDIGNDRVAKFLETYRANRSAMDDAMKKIEEEMAWKEVENVGFLGVVSDGDRMVKRIVYNTLLKTETILYNNKYDVEKLNDPFDF